MDEWIEHLAVETEFLGSNLGLGKVFSSGLFPLHISSSSSSFPAVCTLYLSLMGYLLDA